MQKLAVPAGEAGRRIDKYLMKYYDAAPKSFFYKAFRKKNIKLCGKRADGSEILQAGDIIELYFSDERIASLRSGTQKAEENHGTAKPKSTANVSAGDISRKLDQFCSIVYEDENVIVANKLSGVLSQKAEPGDYSLNEALLAYCGGKKTDSTYTPSICNRLDRNTSGLVLFAKTYGASRELAAVIKDRSVQKYYIAAVQGIVKGAGHLHAWIVKDEKTNKVTVADTQIPGAAHIETRYEVLDAAEFGLSYGNICGVDYTLLKIELITGKTHQIRAHLSHIGHPILGDMKYGDRMLCKSLKNLGIHSQMLHAWELIMPDDLNVPIGNLSGLKFQADLPKTFNKLKKN